MESLEKLIGLPLNIVEDRLKKNGKKVIVKTNSLPKIKTDYQLVTLVKVVDEDHVEITVGDFLINIENKIK